MDMQINMPDRLKIVFCKVVNSFGDGRQTGCRNDSQFVAEEMQFEQMRKLVSRNLMHYNVTDLTQRY